MTIREAREDDVPQMVMLSAAKRTEYEAYQPLFWRKASDAEEQQKPFFRSLLTRENVIALVAERGDAVQGFIIATLVGSPPVYDPGGLTCLVDDFTVAAPDLWTGAGKELLEAATQRAKVRGAVQVVAVCGQKDEPKRSLLAEVGCSVASEWWTKPL